MISFVPLPFQPRRVLGMWRALFWVLGAGWARRGIRPGPWGTPCSLPQGFPLLHPRPQPGTKIPDSNSKVSLGCPFLSSPPTTGLHCWLRGAQPLAPPSSLPPLYCLPQLHQVQGCPVWSQPFGGSFYPECFASKSGSDHWLLGRLVGFGATAQTY